MSFLWLLQNIGKWYLYNGCVAFQDGGDINGKRKML